MSIAEDIKREFDSQYTTRLEVAKMDTLMKDLVNDKYIPKQKLLDVIPGYMIMVHDLIEKLLELGVKSHINVVAQKKVIEEYEQGIDEVNKMVDDL